MKTDRLIPLADVLNISGLSKSELYRRIAAGTFPAQVNLGWSSRWSEQEVGQWVEQQKAARPDRRKAS